MKERISNVWKRQAKKLKMETYAVYLAYKDPRVPWYAKLLIICVFGYLLSPMDKLLDSIPIIGYLDHLILLPIGVAWALKKMIPPTVLTDCRHKARIAMNQKDPKSCIDGFIVIFIWLLFASVIIVFTIWIMKDWNAVLKWWLGWFMKMTKWRNHMPVHSRFYDGGFVHQVRELEGG